MTLWVFTLLVPVLCNTTYVNPSNFHSLQAVQTCSCTHLYAPPPCAATLMAATSTNRHAETVRTSADSLTDWRNQSAHGDRPGNLTDNPWTVVMDQLANSLEKVRRLKTRNLKKEWLISRARSDGRSTVDMLPFMHTVDEWFERVKSKRPSNRRLSRLRHLHNSSILTNQQIDTMPRPFDVIKHFETLGQLYIFAIFEQWCSFDFHRAPTKLLPLCIEYWFTSWPFQPLPDYDCTYSPSEVDGLSSYRPRYFI